MKHLALLLAIGLPVAAGDEVKRTPAPDLAEMPASIHAPLFHKKRVDGGALTERLVPSGAKAAQRAMVPVRNLVDRHIFGKMERDGVPHAPLATDQEFMRRVTLDLTGRIPAAADMRAFLADPSPDKRARLIDRLIGSPAFVDKWAYFLMDTFRANGKMMRGVSLFHMMLKDSLAADRPYDDLARSIMAASGKSNYVVAAANPIVREHVEGKPGEADDGDDLRKIHQMDTHDELTILFESCAFPGLLDQAFQFLFDLVRREGLPDVSVRPQLQRFHHLRFTAFGRHHDHRNLLPTRRRPNLAQQLQPVHVRHIDVAQNQLHLRLLHHFQRFAAIARLHYRSQLYVGLDQHPLQDLPYGRRIVDDQNIYRHSVSLPVLIGSNR